MRKPDFFIVGAPKCGTTAMNAYLRQHPQIYIPSVKDIYFFASDLNSSNSMKQLTEERYLSFFDGATSQKRVGESSVWYLYSEQAAARIKQFSPRASIIIMLRHPVEMLYSLHSQFLYTGLEQIVSFKEALNAEEKRKKGLGVPAGEYMRRKFFSAQLLFYRDIAQYTAQVQRYFDTFGRDNVHVIIFDEFRNDPAQSYRDTLRFLGVDKDFQPTFNIINSNKSWRSLGLHKFFRTPPAIISQLGKLLPDQQRLALRRTFENLNTSNRSRERLDPQLKRTLQAEFEEEIQNLAALLGRDLSAWIQHQSSQEHPVSSATPAPGP